MDSDRSNDNRFDDGLLVDGRGHGDDAIVDLTTEEGGGMGGEVSDEEAAKDHSSRF